MEIYIYIYIYVTKVETMNNITNQFPQNPEIPIVYLLLTWNIKENDLRKKYTVITNNGCNTY